MNNSTSDSSWRLLKGFGEKVLFVAGFALTPIAMGGLVQDVDSWGGVYGWLVHAWDNGFRQPVSAFCNFLLGWSGISISGSVIDYITLGGIVVASYHRTTIAFTHFVERAVLPWARTDLPLYVRWPLGIALWPLTVTILYFMFAVGFMLLLLSDRWLGQGQGSDSNRTAILKSIAAASAFLLALLLPFILKALDAQGTV